MFSSISYPSILLKFKYFISIEEREKPFMQWDPILNLPLHVNSGTLHKKLLSVSRFFLACIFNSIDMDVIFLLSCKISLCKKFVPSVRFQQNRSLVLASTFTCQVYTGGLPVASMELHCQLCSGLIGSTTGHISFLLACNKGL